MLLPQSRAAERRLLLALGRPTATKAEAPSPPLERARGVAAWTADGPLLPEVPSAVGAQWAPSTRHQAPSEAADAPQLPCGTL